MVTKPAPHSPADYKISQQHVYEDSDDQHGQYDHQVLSVNNLVGPIDPCALRLERRAPHLTGDPDLLAGRLR